MPKLQTIPKTSKSPNSTFIPTSRLEKIPLFPNLSRTTKLAGNPRRFRKLPSICKTSQFSGDNRPPRTRRKTPRATLPLSVATVATNACKYQTTLITRQAQPSPCNRLRYQSCKRRLYNEKMQSAVAKSRKKMSWKKSTGKSAFSAENFARFALLRATLAVAIFSGEGGKSFRKKIFFFFEVWSKKNKRQRTSMGGPFGPAAEGGKRRAWKVGTFPKRSRATDLWARGLLENAKTLRTQMTGRPCVGAHNAGVIYIHVLEHVRHARCTGGAWRLRCAVNKFLNVFFFSRAEKGHELRFRENWENMGFLIHVV